jgi:hypothetical protein
METLIITFLAPARRRERLHIIENKYDIGVYAGVSVALFTKVVVCIYVEYTITMIFREQLMGSIKTYTRITPH